MNFSEFQEQKEAYYSERDHYGKEIKKLDELKEEIRAHKTENQQQLWEVTDELVEIEKAEKTASKELVKQEIKENMNIGVYIGFAASSLVTVGIAIINMAIRLVYGIEVSLLAVPTVAFIAGSTVGGALSAIVRCALSKNGPIRQAREAKKYLKTKEPGRKEALVKEKERLDSISKDCYNRISAIDEKKEAYSQKYHLADQKACHLKSAITDALFEYYEEQGIDLSLPRVMDTPVSNPTENKVKKLKNEK